MLKRAIMAKRFEVQLYNTEVRRIVDVGEHHKRYDDEWADPHFIEIEAKDEHEARMRSERRYPRIEGFTIVTVEEIDED